MEVKAVEIISEVEAKESHVKFFDPFRDRLKKEPLPRRYEISIGVKPFENRSFSQAGEPSTRCLKRSRADFTILSSARRFTNPGSGTARSMVSS